MITSYTIHRLSKNLYIVKAGDEIVKECASYGEAEKFIFLANTKELLNGYQLAA